MIPKNLILGVLLAALVLPGQVMADTLKVGKKISIEYTLPSESWVFSKTAPRFVVEEMAEHIMHDALDKGRQLDRYEAISIATEYLRSNEGFVFNPESQAFLSIDFSPLRWLEKTPTEKNVKWSAEAALQSLSGEEGVVMGETSLTETRLQGARSAYRIDATYTQHDQPKQFIGIVGFVGKHWFWLYYTDSGARAQDYPEMESFLENLVVISEN